MRQIGRSEVEGRKWAWLGCRFLQLLIRLFICYAEDGYYRKLMVETSRNDITH